MRHWWTKLSVILPGSYSLISLSMFLIMLLSFNQNTQSGFVLGMNLAIILLIMTFPGSRLGYLLTRPLNLDANADYMHVIGFILCVLILLILGIFLDKLFFKKLPPTSH
jgi:hypothetical protein